MSKVFISYSRDDTEQAVALADRLRAGGIDVWIDRGAIEAAAHWSKEIVGAIESCPAFLLLLSKKALLSKHMVSELSIASESNRKIVPIDLEPIRLPSAFRYQLAGIQRSTILDFDAILRTLTKLLDEAKAKVTQTPLTSKPFNDGRMSLLVLPLEDLSPSGEDNAWFADGLTGELIDALSHVKALRLIDRKTAMDLKGYRGKTMEIAESLDVRYIIEGNVRKFGEQLKISVQLLDIETGDYLWHESHRGDLSDIFDLQEAVAKKVVEGLRVTLTNSERSKLQARGTENSEAYELVLRAREYIQRETREGYQHAVKLISDAIAIDPKYADAYQLKANALASLYWRYNPNPEYLAEGEKLVEKALAIKPDLWKAYYPKSIIYYLQKKLKAAEEAAMEYVKRAPDEFLSHHALGFFYGNTGQAAKAIAPYEQALKLKPDNRASLFNIISICDAAGDLEKRKYWAASALPFVDSHLRLHPDDEASRVQRAFMLICTEQLDQARVALGELKDLRDPNWLYNASCMIYETGDRREALATFRKAIELGYHFEPLMRKFLNQAKEELGDLPEFEDVRQLVEGILAEKALTEASQTAE